MAGKFEVLWAAEAVNRLEKIELHLTLNWPDQIINKFWSDVKLFDSRLEDFPFIYPASQKMKNLRLGLIHPHFFAVYQVHQNQVEIITVIDNRTSESDFWR